MPKILTDVDAFSADVTVPEGGDARTAASVEPAFQKLANRTRYVKNLVEQASGPVVRWIAGSAGWGSDEFGNNAGWRPSVSFNWFGAATSVGAARAKCVFNLASVVPNGCTITQIRVRVDPATAQATATNRMNAQIHVSDQAGDVSAGTVVYTDATDTAQWITISGLSIVVDKTQQSYEVAVENSVTYAADVIFGVEVTFTTTKKLID